MIQLVRQLPGYGVLGAILPSRFFVKTPCSGVIPSRRFYFMTTKGKWSKDKPTRPDWYWVRSKSVLIREPYEACLVAQPESYEEGRLTMKPWGWSGFVDVDIVKGVEWWTIPIRGAGTAIEGQCEECGVKISKHCDICPKCADEAGP